MAVENLLGAVTTNVLAAGTHVPVAQLGGRVRVAVDTVEVSAAASITSTYHLARIPSNALILPTSTLYWDDLSASGSPTLDLGVFAVAAGSFADDPDALTDTLDVTSAGSASVLKDVADCTKRIWEHIADQTDDPGGVVDIKATLSDAVASTGGSLTLVLHYAVD